MMSERGESPISSDAILTGPSWPGPVRVIRTEPIGATRVKVEAVSLDGNDTFATKVLKQTDLAQLQAVSAVQEPSLDGDATGFRLAAESNIGIVHVCHAADKDIDGFADKPVWYQWQLVKMPTAPLIRLGVAILDDPDNPYRFESFLNVTQEDQAKVLEQLANQERLYLAFHGDDLDHGFTKVIDHDKQQWQYLDELMDQAMEHWDRPIP